MSSGSSGRFATYKKRLAAISARTGAPLPSLVLSFGILHEITAVVPLVCFFYGARASGIGERVVSAIIEDDKSNDSRGSEGPRQLEYAKQKMRTWLQEGDRWAIRMGRRYGIFGYEKREAGAKDDVEEMTKISGHLAGDVANAVLAYGITKSLLPIHCRTNSKDHCPDSPQVMTASGTWEWLTKSNIELAPQHPPMTKIKFKRTAEEEAQHQARKEIRRERKRKREHCQAGSSKHYRNDDPSSRPTRKWASSDEEPDCEPEPSGSRSPNYEALQAEIEERRFREKMFDAMGDDERLDGLETGFNHFAHIPDRWKPSVLGKEKARAQMYEGDGYLKMDPNAFDDEEYAEWIRIGMYRKTHAEEYAEQQRKKAEHAARKAEAKARKAETKRLEKLVNDERKRLEEERDIRRLEMAREEYNSRWVALLASVGERTEGADLGFHDIPWPVVAAYRRRRIHDEDQCLKVEDITAKAISLFLFSGEKREKLREAIRRFHPDKFEGRFIPRVRAQDQGRVLEAIGQVSRILNSLLKS